jgi:hypothetical protein
MLADERAQALVDNLAGQWLHIRAVDDAFPDVWVFPSFDETLRSAMAEEMTRMAAELFLSDRSMLDLLTFEETVVNERLAEHYGLQSQAEGWSSANLEETSRMGWLTTGGLLTLTSFPTRTSPVLRGKWVLDNLLCEPPPPPPDNVDAILDDGEEHEGESLVDRLLRHSSDPMCAACHQYMDPIGLGFEQFDGVGQWREVDELGRSIEPAGQLVDGFSFSSTRALSEHIAVDPKFPACMVEQTFVYALGRATEKPDAFFLERIGEAFTAGDFRFEELAVAIVLSAPFRTRHGEEESP